jgi:hypothetical protein
MIKNINAQEYLEKYYPKNGICQIDDRWRGGYQGNLIGHSNQGKSREQIILLDISLRKLEGILDLTDFINLEKLKSF